MLALEIRINGELKATCGTENAEWLTATIFAKRIVSMTPEGSSLAIQCVGARTIDADTRELLKWLESKVRFGDEIAFRFVDATQVLEPIDRQIIAARRDPPDA